MIAEGQDFCEDALRLLRPLGRVVLADLDRLELLRSVRKANVLWVRLRNRIDAEVLGAARHLELIATPTTGLNHIDLDAAEARGVRVLSLRGEVEFLRTVRATAEHTLCLILALLRRLPAAVEHARAGGWNRDQFRGGEIHGRTVGIIGYGRLGRIVAEYVQALGANVLATDPAVQAATVPRAVRLVSLPELIAEAEIVSLHASHSAGSDCLLGAKEFEGLRPGALFVNTARGELVDEDALVDALRSGRLGGAALDVLRDERSTGMEHHPLVLYAREHTNLLLTPHIGGSTVESMRKTEIFLAERVAAALSGSVRGAGSAETIANAH